MLITIIKGVLYILILISILYGLYNIFIKDDKKVGYISFIFSVLVFLLTLIPVDEKTNLNEDEFIADTSKVSSEPWTNDQIETSNISSEKDNNMENTKITTGIIKKTEFESNSTKETTSIITTEAIRMEYIANMELFADGSDGYNKNKFLIDNYRNIYTSSISVDSGYISYLVKNMGYTHFCGTIALPKDVKPDGYKTSAQLEIYIDEVLVFRSDTFTSESKPQQFDLDISNAEVIKISWTCSGGNIWSNWCYYATIFDGKFKK